MRIMTSIDNILRDLSTFWCRYYKPLSASTQFFILEGWRIWDKRSKLKLTSNAMRCYKYFFMQFTFSLRTSKFNRECKRGNRRSFQTLALLVSTLTKLPSSWIIQARIDCYFRLMRSCKNRRDKTYKIGFGHFECEKSFCLL